MNIGAILTKFTKLLKLTIISRKATLNPHQRRSKTKFTAFCRFLLAARQSLRAVSALAPQRRFA